MRVSVLQILSLVSALVDFGVAYYKRRRLKPRRHSKL
jgi:hypothetical protein